MTSKGYGCSHGPRSGTGAHRTNGLEWVPHNATSEERGTHEAMADQERDDVVEAGAYRLRRFKRTRARVKQEPTLRIQKSGEIHVNDAALELIGTPEAVTAVELLYDPDNNVLGLRPSDSKNWDAFPRRRDKKRPYIHIFAGRSFTQFHGIDTGVARRYPAKVVDGILVADLNAGESVGTGRGGAEGS